MWHRLAEEVKTSPHLRINAAFGSKARYVIICSSMLVLGSIYELQYSLDYSIISKTRCMDILKVNLHVYFMWNTKSYVLLILSRTCSMERVMFISYMGVRAFSSYYFKLAINITSSLHFFPGCVFSSAVLLFQQVKLRRKSCTALKNNRLRSVWRFVIVKADPNRSRAK